ncbi:sigma-54 dependent transcriptional regulator [Chitinivorax sp. B]|uniref:sigma 54-interacting transcriptional regulator n=1 Tax=Chitinivorax sp. B TaxID=2502235 RepID=UPI0010F9FB3B|nr:sigma-54 dependent transcriptional regulator [Chitinivorax sp. B]
MRRIEESALLATGYDVLPVTDTPPVSSHVDHNSALFQQAEDLASLPIDILIEGETGVGKDTLARHIHTTSGRTGSFVALNCAAIPETLAESELFGVEAGAYTGATRSRGGKVEASHKGTLYLDEIDSMPMSLQAKLLRVLQERGCERVGSTRFQRFDLRVLASTKVPFDQLVTQNRFRADLYYRLNVVSLRLPPLRERSDEILPLFRRFVLDSTKRFERIAPDITPHIESMLLAHNWPGNVRELKTAAERFSLGLAPINCPCQNGRADEACEEEGGLRSRMRDIERALIVSALTRHAGSVKLASEDLKIPMHTLYYRIRTLAIQNRASQGIGRIID